MQFNVVPRTGGLAINRGKRGVRRHNSHTRPMKPPSDTDPVHWQSLRPGETKGTRDDKEAMLAAPLGSGPSGSPSRTTL